MLAHGPINYHPIFLGTPEQVADKFQLWFEAGVGKGFAVVPDSGLLLTKGEPGVSSLSISGLG